MAYPPEVIAEFEAAIQRLIELRLIEAKDDGYIFVSSLPTQQLPSGGDSPDEPHRGGDSVERSSAPA